MRSIFAALRTLVLPYGATTGQRIILDGVNGQILIYDATDQLVARLDGDGLLIETDDGVITGTDAGLSVLNDNGGQVLIYTLPGGMLAGGGAIVALQPADVAGIVFNAGQLFANSFPGQNNAPATQLYSPQIQPGGLNSSVVLVGEDDAGNPPTIDLRAPGGRVRILQGRLVDEDNISYPVCQQGTDNLSVTAPAATLTQAVVFPVPFDTVPNVMVNLNGNSGLYARWGARAINLTTAGFSIFIFAVNPTTNGNNFSVDVDWTATAIS